METLGNVLDSDTVGEGVGEGVVNKVTLEILKPASLYLLVPPCNDYKVIHYYCKT